LLHQADPELSTSQIIHAITSTAVPIGDSIPNLDAGWGRVDALAAISFVLKPGYLEGTVRTMGNLPISGATVRATQHGVGTQIDVQTDSNGHWSITALPGIYDLEASAFGFAPAVETGVTVLTDTTTSQIFTLHRLPGGYVEGQVLAADGGQPLPAIIRVIGTPLTTTADLSGIFALELPPSTYTLTAELWGYRIGREVIDVGMGQTTVQDFSLESSPQVLLVDSGAWYYGSEIDFYESTLHDLGYLYEEKRIKHLPQETPTITDLLTYDAVVWSSPADSPGLIGAGSVISDYLSAGGNLLLSGQNIGFWDSGASGLLWSAYYQKMLRARFLADAAENPILTGTEGGLLETLAFSLNEPGSAENQSSPDVIEPLDPDWTQPLLDYASGGHGGLAASLCLPYRSFYLSFGLEGIASSSSRAELLGRALDWFDTPRPTVGVALVPAASHLVSPAGTSVTHTLQVRNTGEMGTGDDISFSVAGALWPTTVITPSVSLSPCESASVQVRVDIPADQGHDQADQIVLTAHSAVSPTLIATATLLTKSPAPILLVDDDRWYDQESAYQNALEAGDFGYDYWDLREYSGELLFDQLPQYPMVLWFTGYDWYAPLTDQEVSALESYLDGGGRLFLSSQDALYYQHDSRLLQNYLGVLDYQEDITPTAVYDAEGGMAVPSRLELDFPYRNLSDGTMPAAGANVELYDDRGMAAGLSQSGGSDGSWKTSFFPFPFEALPPDSQPLIMEQIVGWHSWLGQSTFEASERVVPAGGTVVFTATLRNDGPGPITAVLSNTIPAGLDYISGTLSGGSYEGGAVYWEGSLPAGGEQVTQYAATVSESISNTVTLHYAEHDLAFRRPIEIWVDAPDLSPSTLTSEPVVVVPGQPVTFTLHLHNEGLVVASSASATWMLPDGTDVLTTTLQTSSGIATIDERQVVWDGEIGVGESITIRVSALTQPGPYLGWLMSTAVLDDGETDLVVRAHTVELRPHQAYLPIVMR
jgi:uncharacterized repeat protein (TIGR01451 family)